MDDDNSGLHPLTYASIVVAVAAIALGNSVDPRFYAGLALLAILLPMKSVLVRRASERAALRRLHAEWGKPIERARDSAALRRLYATCDGAALSPAALDDATWDDLDLDAVLARIDRTLSTPGEYALYEILRTPLLDPAALTARDARIEAFTADVAVRERVREELLVLGRRPVGAVTALLWGQDPRDEAPNSALLALQSAAPLAGVAALLLGGGATAGLFVAAAVVFNVVTHFSRKNEILGQADALKYLAALVRTGARLGKVRPAAGEALAPTLREIDRVAVAARVIARKGARLAWSDEPGGLDVLQSVYEYVSIFLLLEVRGYYAVRGHLAAHREDLRGLFRLVGELDALQSVASWRAGSPRFCRPQFTPGEIAFRVEGAAHPLLDDPTPNSLDLAGRSALVTGSNMAGKSTFLRTLGLCAVLSQTIHTCPAASYRACPLRVASSVTIRDDVVAGRSFYFAEAERLLRLVRYAESAGPVLVLVDEPLRGTNSTERIAAVVEILLHLSAQGALTVAATHELKIAELVRERYDPFHFTDEVGADGLSFPHRIRPGVATTRNAIRLLAKLGYPPDLVARAEVRAAAIDAGG